MPAYLVASKQEDGIGKKSLDLSKHKLNTDNLIEPVERWGSWPLVLVIAAFFSIG
jgi:hypothetical protein